MIDKKKSRLLLFALSILFSNMVFAQNSVSKANSGFEVDKNQHTIEFEFLNIVYSYAGKISNNSFLGGSIHFGFGTRFFLNTPKYLGVSDCDTACTSYYEDSRKGFLSPTREVFKIQLFYRKFISPRFHVEFGGYYSSSSFLGFPEVIMIDHYYPKERNIGVSISVFYGAGKANFGHRIQMGFIERDYNNGLSTNIASIILTPIVVQYFL